MFRTQLSRWLLDQQDLTITTAAHEGAPVDYVHDSGDQPLRFFCRS
jgi:hypothetical protein